MQQFSTTGSEIRDAATAAAFGLDAFDHDAARRDGWVISDCGSYRDGAPRIELQKFDDAETGLSKFRETETGCAIRRREKEKSKKKNMNGRRYRERTAAAKGGSLRPLRWAGSIPAHEAPPLPQPFVLGA